MQTLTWSAVDLTQCRTDFLVSIDRKRIPAPAAKAIMQELIARWHPLDWERQAEHSLTNSAR